MLLAAVARVYATVRLAPIRLGARETADCAPHALPAPPLPPLPPPWHPSAQVSSLEGLRALWRDYFVVTFVRNPYQRAVSSYRMMMRQLAPGGQAAGAYSWNRFCADPTGFANVCEADPVCQK